MTQLTSQQLQNYSKLIEQVRVELNSKFLERKEMIEILLTSLVANLNCQFIGNPGTGKSAIVNALSELIDCSFFNVTLNQDADPDIVIGHISLHQMRDNDKIVRNTKDKIADAEICFLDECNKQSTAMKNALLLPLNERKVDTGEGTPINTKIRMVVGASNEYPACETIDDDTDHLPTDPNWDRYALRQEVSYLKQDSSFLRLLRERNTIGRVDSSKKIPLQVIDDLRSNVSNVQLKKVENILLNLKTELKKANIILSDRRWIMIFKIISARALMRGSDTCSSSDLFILEHAMWRTPEEIKEVKRIITENVRSEYSDAVKVLDMVNAELKDLDKYLNKNGRNEKAVSHLTSVREKLTKHVKASGSQKWSDDDALKVKEKIKQKLMDLNQTLYECLNANNPKI